MLECDKLTHPRCSEAEIPSATSCRIHLRYPICAGFRSPDTACANSPRRLNPASAKRCMRSSVEERNVRIAGECHQTSEASKEQ
jgi:hypothetical protein